MNPQNPDSYCTRMQLLSSEVKKDYFREYMKEVDRSRLSWARKIETILLGHGITISLWIRGLSKRF